MKNRSWIFHLPLYPAIYFCHFNSKTRLLANWVSQPPLSFLWSIIFAALSLIFIILLLIVITLILIVITLSLLCYHFIIDQRKPGRELGLATSPVVPLIIFGATSLLAGILVLILPETRCHYHREPHNHHDQCYYVISLSLSLPTILLVLHLHHNLIFIFICNRNCPLPDTIEQGEAFSKEGGGLAFFRSVIIIIIFHRKESCLHLFNPKSWSLILDTLTPNVLTQYFDA